MVTTGYLATRKMRPQSRVEPDKLKNLDEATFYSPNEDWENKNDSGAGTHFTIAGGERIRG